MRKASRGPSRRWPPAPGRTPRGEPEELPGYRPGGWSTDVHSQAFWDFVVVFLFVFFPPGLVLLLLRSHAGRVFLAVMAGLVPAVAVGAVAAVRFHDLVGVDEPIIFAPVFLATFLVILASVDSIARAARRSPGDAGESGQ